VSAVVFAFSNTCAQWNDQKEQANIYHSTPTSLFIRKSRQGDSKPPPHVVKQHIKSIRTPLAARKLTVKGTNGGGMDGKKPGTDA
jgi:hypothetical protein